ncbi:MAG: SDR family NAD(P)-dependent oxidoreductase [Actinomycetota bacterium]|nr:SDR family NAD(P)-dependent oxidoreductase [Actinomycetota bacterium]
MALAFDKTAVITGADSGLGRALAIELAREGFRIGVLDVNMDEARKTVEMVERAGGTGESFFCDVSDLEQVQAAADHFFDAWGKVGVLVNNAGIASFGVIGDLPIEEWRKVIDVDLWGVIYECHAFVPSMKRQGGSHIINIASMAGVTPPLEEGPYNAAKAVIYLSKTLKQELAPCDIGVTVVCPLGEKTNILKSTDYAGEFILSMWEAAFEHQKLTPEEYARRVVAAAGKDKLYFMPHAVGKFFWLNKRLAPSGLIKALAWLNKKGLESRFCFLLARLGWM